VLANHYIHSSHSMDSFIGKHCPSIEALRAYLDEGEVSWFALVRGSSECIGRGEMWDEDALSDIYGGVFSQFDQLSQEWRALCFFMGFMMPS
jgi:hypothetical protein